MSVTVSETTSASRRWTEEQRLAIEAREGDLLLAAGAGSGKTSVLVERFVRSVTEDGLGVGEILTITFTEKAAAEMRDRIRTRLRELGEHEAAAATEGAFISTIHGFCARVLRAHALAAGLDPGFTVLDEHEAARLTEMAFERALEERLAADERAVDVLAAHGVVALRAGILALYGQLRSRGEAVAVPPLGPAPPLEPALAALKTAAAAAAAELGAVADPGVRVGEALQRLEGCAELGEEPWPGDLERLCLPGAGGVALSTPVCEAYSAALGELRAACEHRHATGAHAVLDGLLRGFAARYAEAKRARSVLDFEDLELLARELLRGDVELRERYRSRFARIMVDELQDTNAVQLELIATIADGNLFTVGDAQQAIYGFRHADVELFERLAAQRAEQGRFAGLTVNFRSRPEVLSVINATFAGEGFAAMVAGRDDPPAGEPRVELLVVDKGADYDDEGLVSPWRLAEARVLATRVAELLAGGAAPRELVVLTRATTDLRTYERALEERGVPTYLIGGRGYWGHPQVLDLLAYLRALANPLDEEALYSLLATPLVGASLDALVLVAAAAETQERPVWSVLREPGEALAELDPDQRRRLSAVAGWLAGERERVGRVSVEELIDRALEHTGYDLLVLRQPGGRRRMANVRKLMRLAREHDGAQGPGLREFLELVGERARAGGDARESEAPVEGEALDAVRLMTIHRSKGLEFEIVCVADLGRQRRPPVDLIRVGADGRVGMRLASPGRGRALPVLAYRQLGEERMAAEEAEERRLFYVAMTRARERLVLSGAARLDTWPESNGGTAIGWLAGALVPDFGQRIDAGPGVSERGVAVTVLREAPAAIASPPPDGPPASGAGSELEPSATPDVPEPADSPPPLTALSYTALSAYRRCGYRFYVERVLGIPAAPGSSEPGRSSLRAAERGVLAHALLEQLDFRRPLAPSRESIALAGAGRGLPVLGESEAAELAALVEAFSASPLCGRLAQATQVRREQRFAFRLPGGLLMTGAIDVLARERHGMLVVDYKSDRLQGRAPAAVVAGEYVDQQCIYALAVLRGGAARVEVAHVFLEAPAEPVLAVFTAADRPALQERAQAATAPIGRGEFAVAAAPHRALCDGCPAQGGLCSWPLPMTQRERPDQLF